MKQNFREVKTEIIENELTDKLMSKEEFMEKHGSGTLRKNARLGFLHRDQYREERIAWELGYQFELLPASRVMIGIPITEGNCHPVTEAGWHIERFLHHKNTDDENFIPAYIRAEYSDGTVNEGIGIFCNQTYRSWIGENNALFAVISEYDPETKEYKEAINPF